MRSILFTAFFFIPALLAAEPPRQQQKETPEVRAQLAKDAAALEAQILARAAQPDPELYMRLGFTYSRLQQADDAQRAFEGALRIDPKKAGAHYMLGLIYEKKGMKDKAIAAWKACLENTTDPRMRDTAMRHLHHLTAIR